MICSIEGCDRKRFAKDMCSAHYSRVRRHGGLERIRLPQDDVCSYDGCDKPSHAKGFCSTHYQQERPALEMVWRLLRSRARGAYPPSWDRWEDFLREVEAELGERPTDKHQLRRLDSSQPWGSGNMVWLEPIGVSFVEDGPYYQWVWNLKNTYDLTPDDCEKIIAFQQGLCPACNKPLGYFGPTSRKEATVVVEHDHIYDGRPMRYAVRGIMHRRCNSGMGMLDDNADNLRAAANHIDAHDRRKALGISILDEIRNGAK